MSKKKYRSPAMLPVKPTQISVVIPFSSVWFGSHLREKTIRAANLLRYASMFRVKKIYVVFDAGSTSFHKELKDLFDYLLLPPYLKAEVDVKPHLRYVGLAPPIKTPLHAVSADPKKAVAEPVRLATVIEAGLKETVLNAGFRLKTVAPPKKNLKQGDHVYVKVVKVGDGIVHAQFVEHDDLRKIYLQPEIMFANPDELRTWLDEPSLKVELTRMGEPSTVLLNKPLKGDVIFFVGNQLSDPEELLDIGFDYKIRLLPEQGVETIRSEEAILIALAQTAWISV